MNPLVRTGVALVVAALASYTVAVIGERRRGRVSPGVLLLLTVGVMFDVTAALFRAISPAREAAAATPSCATRD
jgi:ABC-type Fe3+-siderophore transport system permease subunit